jgi:type I restriction enzyme S subunit
MTGEWEDLTLGDLGRVVTGKTPLTSVEENFGGRIPFVTPSDMDGRKTISTTNRFLTQAGAASVKGSIIPGGAVMVSCIGSDMGKVVIAARECVTNQQINSIVVDDRFSSEFVYYSLSTRKNEIRHQAAGGSAVPILNKRDFSRIEIKLPPIAEQKAIAAVLGALDDKIELNRQMNATLEAMARALFQSWFVDFDPVRAKLDGRQPANLDPTIAGLFPEHLEDSPLGKKPIGWEVAVLDNVLAVLETGGRPKGGVGGITSGVPSIGAESIVSVGVFDFGKTKFVPVEFYEGMRKGHIQSHDVLLYKDGGRPGEYEPHVSMFGDGFPFEKCSINEHVYRLRTNERLSQEYLYFWMTSEFALAEMRIKGTGVAIPGLNSTAVRTLGVLVPPQPIVQAFTKQVAPLVTRILSNAKQSRTLATLRDTLLPKLLSGELSLRPDHV